ncbi:unnamed protein product [Schistosoma curassoni]|uniref:Uncharacterized protein n=1 Tax=Schistosoma curassoni TaxID=6186 RepID=A0A183JF34_9TREM|nr:unnamed protein product [Schistosoma curassoni]
MDKNVQDELPILEGLNNKVEKIEKIETETKSLQVGFEVTACLVMQFDDLRNVCPIQFHPLFLISSSAGEMNQNIRSLENEINRLNDENKKLDFDLKLSKKQTNAFQMDYMNKFINEIDLLKNNEKNIYTYGCRLNTVGIENARINAVSY